MEFLVEDLSGRCFVTNVNESDILDFKLEVEGILDDETFEEWIEFSIVGDKLEANAIRITRTK